MEGIHPAVELLLKRIETHPDEFALSGGRWDKMISRFEPYFSEAEHDAVLAAVSRVRLDALHKELMQEMLNPPSTRGPKVPFADVSPPSSRTTLQVAAGGAGITTAPATTTASTLSARGVYDQLQAHNCPASPLSPKGFPRALKGIFS